ncbi:MAG: hypothetical protein HY432_03600 [Candidatus Liptonbacteria bacterium]|nr:hypothetical protein [Candidatus Liptonbacteria bacterium]
MIERIKKLYQSVVPIAVIAAVLFFSISLINGAVVFPKLTIPLGKLQPNLASVSLAAKNFVILLQKTAIDTAKNFASQTTAPGDSGVPVQDQNGSSNSALTGTTGTPTSTVTTTVTNPSRTTSTPANSSGIPTVVPATPGVPDLEIKTVDIGILEGNTFVHADSVKSGQKAAIVFDIKNIGTRVSPEWDFYAQIPSSVGNYKSNLQSPLAPGEYVRFTLGFDNLNSSGTNFISITADPDSKVSGDPNRANNVATTTIVRGY